MSRVECDVLVAGAGAGGLAAAIPMAKAGLDVLVVEKAPVFGGTTAFSGGVLWTPCHHLGNALPDDSIARAHEYLMAELGAFADEDAIELFLANAPRMVDWFQRETRVRFVPTLYPDYHPDAPGGVPVGRSILAEPFDITELGEEMHRLRPPLQTITFMGMMFNSSNADLKHFFNATRSLRSFAYVARRLTRHLGDLLRHGRAAQVTSGNALAARLAASAFDAGVKIWTDTPLCGLIMDGGAVRGARIERHQQPLEVHARHGVVLACGGFPQDPRRTAERYPHRRRGGEHCSPTPAENTGDGIRIAERAGARMAPPLASPAAWMPVSRVPLGRGRVGAFPHLLDRYKPGVIGVNARGERFCNESEAYHDVGLAMIRDGAHGEQTAMWLVCDRRALRRYGLGAVKPAPVPIGAHLRSGYLLQGRTLSELAQRAGIEAAALERTVQAYNADAQHGRDPAFGRGRSAFNRYLADPEQQPNPCVAPLLQGPFYAVKLVMGELGTFEGLSTTPLGAVRDRDGQPIAGLYAAGNDRVSVMGGHYPAAGITLGPNMTFGWLTGRHIAETARAQGSP